MIWFVLKRIPLLIVIVVSGLLMANCTMLGLNYASLETENKPAPSPILDVDLVRSDPSQIRAVFEEELYGPWPENLPVSAALPRMINDTYLEGRGTLQEIMVTIGEGVTARTFPVVLALPNAAIDTAVPLIISQTFAGNCSVFPGAAVSNRDGSVCVGDEMSGMYGAIATGIFGTYIAKAPIERYFDAGMGYASFEGSGFVEDRSEAAAEIMAALSPGPKPTSALMAWGYAFHGVAGVLAEDERIKAETITAMGHSRYGKSALIAAAWSQHIHGAITHQSGFAGAASSRSPSGERLDRMSASYPHWVRPGLAVDLEAGWQPTYDQHYLLALAAPKPIFLGNGRRDVWSGPNSTYRNAEAADAAYEALGVGGLPETGGMQAFDPSAEISYWLRPGGHSVVSEDIDAFIAFMTAHFG